MKRTISLLLGLVLILSISACGKNAPTWQEQYDLGLRYLSEGNYEEAILAFESAIQIDPRQENAYLSLAQVYTAQGDTTRAAEILEQAVETIGATDALAAALDALAPEPEPQPQPEPESSDQSLKVEFVSGTLTFSDVSATYVADAASVQYYSGAIGYLDLSLAVSGPEEVFDAVPYSYSLNGFTENQIQVYSADAPEQFKNRSIYDRTPPFTSTTKLPLTEDMPGNTLHVLVFGLDQSLNAVAHSVLTISVPG